MPAIAFALGVAGVGAQSGPPGPPQQLRSQVVGNFVTLTFQAPSSGEPATGYLIEAGSALGLANLARLEIGLTTSFTASAPDGVYYVRVRAFGSNGIGVASNEVQILVGVAGCQTPSAPNALTAQVTDTTVHFAWQPPTIGIVDRYELRAGTRPGDRSLVTVNVGAAQTFSAAALFGTYYLGVVAINNCGTGAESSELVVVVGETAPIPRNPNIPPGLLTLLKRFGNGVERGAIRVFSTISPSFSADHAAHAELTWNFFKTVFAKSMGARTELYYTRDEALYREILAYCPTTFIPGARSLTACWDPVERIYIWVIIPYITPDFGTQLHELSHSFLYATWLPAETNVWLKEGTGMYYESGTFAGTDLVIQRPLPYLTTHFRRWSNAGRILSLATLTHLTRDQFYAQEPTLVYSQAGMFFYYLAKQHPATVTELIRGLNAGTLRDNEDVLALITSSTGLSLDALDQQYRQYALQF